MESPWRTTPDPLAPPPPAPRPHGRGALHSRVREAIVGAPRTGGRGTLPPGQWRPGASLYPQHASSGPERVVEHPAGPGVSKDDTTVVTWVTRCLVVPVHTGDVALATARW